MSKIRICDVCHRNLTNANKAYFIKRDLFSSIFEGHQIDICGDCLDTIINGVKCGKEIHINTNLCNGGE